MIDALLDFGEIDFATSNLAPLGLLVAFPDCVDLQTIAGLGARHGPLFAEFSFLTTIGTNGTHLHTFGCGVAIAGASSSLVAQYSAGAASTLAIGPELCASDAAGTGWAHVAEPLLTVYCAIPPYPVRDQDRVASPLVAASGGNHAGSFTGRRYLHALVRSFLAVDTVTSGTVSARLVAGSSVPYLISSGFAIA